MKRLRIVCTDKFARENTSDLLVADYVHPQFADVILQALREKFSMSDGPDWFVVRDDLYMQRMEHVYGFNTPEEDWWEQQIEDLKEI